MTQTDWKRFAALLDFDHDGSVRIDECAPTITHDWKTRLAMQKPTAVMKPA